MNSMFRRSINEYARQTEAKKTFAAQIDCLANRMKTLSFDENAELPFHLANHKKRMLLLLVPLIETGWADGRITQRESEAILQAAEAYGLTECEASYVEIITRLTTRSTPREIEEFWRRLGQLFLCLSREDRQILKRALQAQAEFVAERSSNDFVSFLQGVGICSNERETLRQIEAELEKADQTARLLEIEKSRALRNWLAERRQTAAAASSFNKRYKPSGTHIYEEEIGGAILTGDASRRGESVGA